METPPSARKRGFKLEFVGDNSEKENLCSKIQKIKQSTNERMTYTDVMNQALDFWINSNLMSNQDNNSENDSVPPPSDSFHFSISI